MKLDHITLEEMEPHKIGAVKSSVSSEEHGAALQPEVAKPE